MNIFITDSQVVGETEATLFSLLQQGAVEALIRLRNAGSNTINFRYQQFNGTAWVDMGSSGTELNSTLTAEQTKSFKILASYSQVRLVGNASGGSLLEFSADRYFVRASGGSIPILSL